MPSFQILAVDETTREWKTKDGKKTFTAYKVQFKGDQGEGNAELSRLNGTPAPTVGETIDAELKNDNPAFPAKLVEGFKGGKGGGGKSPKERAEIRRMASQKCALELLRIETDIAIAMKDEHSEKLFAKLRAEGGLSGHIEARTSFFESHAKAAEA
jgi:hypothetical protein